MKPERRNDRSPFPGMDPYLERYWLSVHTLLISRLADELNRRLPDDLVAAPGERMEVVPRRDADDDAEGRRDRLPDVVVTGGGEGAGAATAVAEMIEAEPGVVVAAATGPAMERYLHVIDMDSERVVTAIEMVSPSNKRMPGLAEFQDKREAMLHGGANWVEIDLIRAGDWRRLMGTVTVVGQPGRPDPTNTAYRLSIRSPARPNRVYLFPFGLRDQLPALVLPLRSVDPRVQVDLQPLLDDVYKSGRYGQRIDYDRSLDLPLSKDDAAWAQDLLVAAGRVEA